MNTVIFPLFNLKSGDATQKKLDLESLILDLESFWVKNIKKNPNIYSPIWQTLKWGELLNSSRSVVSINFIGIYQNEELLGYVLLESRVVGLGMRGGYIVGGPNISINTENSEEFQNVLVSLLQGIEKVSQSEKNIFTVIEPIQNEFNSVFDYDFFNKSALCSKVQLAGKSTVKTFVEPFTRVIDLLKTEEELLADMKQKGRYNIRLAEKNGCITKRVEPTTEMIDIFMRLLNETLERDGFSGNSRRYYETMLAGISAPGGLYIVYHENTPIAAAIMTVSGNTAVYYYGASTSDNTLRKHMPAYLLQWTMISTAKSAGLKWYDFLGIADPEKNDSPLAGVSDFKAKFGGEIWKLPNKYILVHSKLSWLFFQSIRIIKKNILSRHA